jgi:hypothetical protein
MDRERENPGILQNASDAWSVNGFRIPADPDFRGNRNGRDRSHHRLRDRSQRRTIFQKR